VTPVDFIEEIDALPRGLRRQAMLNELSDDGIGFQIENGSVITFDLEIAFIDNVEHRIREKAQGKQVSALDLENFCAVDLFDRHLDR
jgi:hypothetical protein